MQSVTLLWNGNCEMNTNDLLVATASQLNVQKRLHLYSRAQPVVKICGRWGLALSNNFVLGVISLIHNWKACPFRHKYALRVGHLKGASERALTDAKWYSTMLNFTSWSYFLSMSGLPGPYFIVELTDDGNWEEESEWANKVIACQRISVHTLHA